jgi:hypothetical protein
MAYKENNSLDMFLSVHSSIEFPLNTNFGRLGNEDSLYLLTNFMSQGEYNRFDIGTQYVNGNFSFGMLAATNPIRKNPNSHFLTSVNAHTVSSIKQSKMLSIFCKRGLYELHIQ